MITKIKSIINGGSERSVNAKKNIISSFGLKAISIYVSLQIVPLTIDFVNPTMYGIWLTLSSIIAWASYFDLGLANGFKNKFAEAKAKGEDDLARKYLSTTYIVLAAIFTTLAVIICFINSVISWSSILNIDSVYDKELRTVFFILTSFFCLNFVFNIINMFLSACQMPAISSLLQTMGQVFALLGIIFFTKTVDGSLVYLAFAFSGLPCLVLIVGSFIIFRLPKFKLYRPSLSLIDFSLTKSIIGLGSKFFLITASMLVLFQLINILLSRLQGPEIVTQYNVSYKYFNLIHMAFAIIISPIWAAFTDAYTKRDYDWMKNVLDKMDKMLILTSFVAVFMLMVSPVVFDIWIGDTVTIPFATSASTVIYVYAITCGMVYMHMINGIGKIKLQLVIYVVYAIIAFPLLYFSCKFWGVSGILITPSVVYFTQALLVRIQLKKILRMEATGLWNK